MSIKNHRNSMMLYRSHTAPRSNLLALPSPPSVPLLPQEASPLSPSPGEIVLCFNPTSSPYCAPKTTSNYTASVSTSCSESHTIIESPTTTPPSSPAAVVNFEFFPKDDLAIDVRQLDDVAPPPPLKTPSTLPVARSFSRPLPASRTHTAPSSSIPQVRPPLVPRKTTPSPQKASSQSKKPPSLPRKPPLPPRSASTPAVKTLSQPSSLTIPVLSSYGTASLELTASSTSTTTASSSSTITPERREEEIKQQKLKNRPPSYSSSQKATSLGTVRDKSSVREEFDFLRAAKSKGEVLARYAGFGNDSALKKQKKKNKKKKGTFVVMGPGRDGSGNLVRGAEKRSPSREERWPKREASRESEGQRSGEEARKGVAGSVLDRGKKFAGF